MTELCSKCSKPFTSDSKFCRKCGTERKRPLSKGAASFESSPKVAKQSGLFSSPSSFLGGSRDSGVALYSGKEGSQFLQLTGARSVVAYGNQAADLGALVTQVPTVVHQEHKFDADIVVETDETHLHTIIHNVPVVKKAMKERIVEVPEMNIHEKVEVKKVWPSSSEIEIKTVERTTQEIRVEPKFVQGVQKIVDGVQKIVKSDGPNEQIVEVPMVVPGVQKIIVEPKVTVNAEIHKMKRLHVSPTSVQTKEVPYIVEIEQPKIVKVSKQQTRTREEEVQHRVVEVQIREKEVTLPPIERVQEFAVDRRENVIRYVPKFVASSASEVSGGTVSAFDSKEEQNLKMEEAKQRHLSQDLSSLEKNANLNGQHLKDLIIELRQSSEEKSSLEIEVASLRKRMEKMQFLLCLNHPGFEFKEGDWSKAFFYTCGADFGAGATAYELAGWKYQIVIPAQRKARAALTCSKTREGDGLIITDIHRGQWADNWNKNHNFAKMQVDDNVVEVNGKSKADEMLSLINTSPAPELTITIIKNLRNLLPLM